MTRTRQDSQTSLRIRKALCPAPLAFAIALSINVANAATIVVDSPDAASETGKCTIVDAVQALNTQSAVNNCRAGDGNNDTIDLTSFTTQTTITLTSSAPLQSHALVTSKAATITAPLDPTGAPLVTLTRSTVTGAPAFGIIQNQAPLTIYGLQISNGDAGEYLGGGILGSASLTIESSVISNNHSDSAGGGIAATQDVTVTNSIVSGNTAGNAGGGIDGSTSVSLYYSTINNNSTMGATSAVNGGGGVFATGFVKVIRSDVLDNTSASAGGGVYTSAGANVTSSTISGNMAVSGSGGGIYGNPAAGTVSITRSTINDNTVHGNGGGVLAGELGIENSTITGNLASGTGGGVQANDLMTNYATIAQNQSTGAGGGVNFATSAEVDATILYGNTMGTNTPDDIETSGSAAITGQYDIIGATAAGEPSTVTCSDPQLSPLADNGGPTQTMALAAGSCAIDKASSAPTVATDQRGYVRAVGGGDPPIADIGAYEAGSMDPDKIFSDGFEGS